MLRPLLIMAVVLSLVSPAAAAKIKIIVDISEQSMVVKLDGERLYRWDVSTGRPGYPTPRGTFPALRLEREYFSSAFANVPMANATFRHGSYAILFYRGFAIHSTRYPGTLGVPHSHGCVYLGLENARTLYRLVQEHGRSDTVIKIVE